MIKRIAHFIQNLIKLYIHTENLKKWSVAVEVISIFVSVELDKFS